jgi:polyhydroxybutyrate depolymerase
MVAILEKVNRNLKANQFLLVFIIFALIVLIRTDVKAQWLKEKIGNFIANKIRTKNKELQIASEKFSINHEGKERTFYVYKPTSWNQKDLIPAVFIFHGGGGNARGAIHFYQLEQTAEKHGFLLVSPNGTGKQKDVFLTWNVGFGFGDAEETNSDDPGFIKTLVEKLCQDYPIDSKRIYATGMSNGAIFCHLLAAQPWNPFSAIAPVAGTLGGKKPGGKKLYLPPKPEKPVSVLLIQGRLDKNVPLEGGKQKLSFGKPREMISASDTLKFWADANKINTEPAISYDSKLKATKISYCSADKKISVTAYYIDNCGHAWPGSKKKPYKRADDPPAQFPANEIIWKFFSNHAK